MSDLAEFSALVDVPEAELCRFASLGLLDLDGDGRFDDLDLLRLWALRHHFRLGRSVEDVAWGLQEGTLKTPFGETLFGDAAARRTPEEAAERTGFSVEDVARVRAALSLPGDMLAEGDIEMLAIVRAIVAAGMPLNAFLEGARVIGDSLRKVAETEARLVHHYVHAQAIVGGVSADEGAVQARDFGVEIAPLLDPLLLFVHRQHLLRAMAEDSFLHPEPPAGVEEPAGALHATVLFLDVASFTSLTEVQGDEAAATMLDRLDNLVRSLALAHGGRLVKQIGDAFMLVFRRPQDAVRLAVDIRAATVSDVSMPPVRVGINEGTVVYRVGEYIGGTVNLAARITAAAMEGEIVFTAAVATSAETIAVPTESVGIRLVRGIDEPVELFRVVSASTATMVDPVCGTLVSDHANSVRLNDTEYVFCSTACLREFLQSQLAAAPSPSSFDQTPP